MQIKAKLGAATAGAEETGDEEVQALTDSATQPTILDVRPKRAASAQKVVAEEERVLAGLEERGVQSVKPQEKLLKPPVRVTERLAYSDWAKSVMEELDPSLWRQFQQEHSQLLYRYLDINDKVRAAAAAIHHTAAVPIQHTAAVPAAVPICHTVSLIISVPVTATTTVVAIHCAARDVSVGLPVIRLGEHPDAAPSAPADNTAACDTISGASCYLLIGCHRLNQHSCLHIGIIVSERQFGTVY